jgi:energy-coupling factor transporter ATP-binding protein EcfA2
MTSRQQTIHEPQIDTCHWFLDSNVFKRWYSRANVEVDVGLLWVKGKPGSGKSTLIKHAAHWTERTEQNPVTVATFYFNARGEVLEKTPLGLFRSILHQMCVQDRTVRAEFFNFYEERLRKTTPGDQWSWAELELQAFMRRIFRECKPRRTFLFIDALDECELQTVRKVVYFLAGVAKSALESGLCLNICLSSRHYPTISVPNCLEIVVDTGNGSDIATYIRDRFSFAPSSEASMVAKLQSTIMEKAAGVFLWAVLVVDILLQDIDAGQSMSKLTERLKQVPRTMEELYAERCQSLSTEERVFSVPLIQWVLFGDESFKRHGFPQAAVLAAHFSSSGFQLQNGLGDNISPKHERTIRRIKDASRGLIEYNTADKKVQFIHETAREFFLTGPGLGLLDARLAENPTGLSYMALVNGCLNTIEASPEPSRVQYWFHWFAGHTRSSVIHYARMVERHGGSNIALVESIKAGRYGALEGMKYSTYGQLERGESFIDYLSRVGLTSCALNLLKQGLHSEAGLDTYMPSNFVAEIEAEIEVAWS